MAVIVDELQGQDEPQSAQPSYWKLATAQSYLVLSLRDSFSDLFQQVLVLLERCAHPAVDEFELWLDSVTQFGHQILIASDVGEGVGSFRVLARQRSFIVDRLKQCSKRG